MPDYEFLVEQYNALSAVVLEKGFDVYFTYVLMDGEVRTFLPKELENYDLIKHLYPVRGEDLFLMQHKTNPAWIVLLEPRLYSRGLEYLVINGFEVS